MSDNAAQIATNVGTTAVLVPILALGQGINYKKIEQNMEFEHHLDHLLHLITSCNYKVQTCKCFFNVFAFYFFPLEFLVKISSL